MQADDIAELAFRSCGSIMDDQVGDGGVEHRNAVRRHNIAHAGDATTLRQNVKQTRGDFDAVTIGNAAEAGRGLAVAGNADVKTCNALDRSSAQETVGG